MKGAYQGDRPLRVGMLGGISVFYGEQELPFRGDRTCVPLYLRFMMLVWLRGEAGVTVDEVQRFMYGDKKLRNPRNSVNNLAYLANRQMVAHGAPDADYFCRTGSRYHPSPEVLLEVDVHRFRALIARARKAGGESTADYKKALSYYKGPLLPELSGELWVAKEAPGLAVMYREACEAAARREMTAGNAGEAEAVYERACLAEPDGGWEAKRIELLLRHNKDREAIQLYEQTIQRYVRCMRSVRADRICESAEDVNRKLLDFTQDVEDAFRRAKCRETCGKLQEPNGSAQEPVYDTKVDRDAAKRIRCGAEGDMIEKSPVL